MIFFLNLAEQRKLLTSGIGGSYLGKQSICRTSLMELKGYEVPEEQSRVLEAYRPVTDSGHLPI